MPFESRHKRAKAIVVMLSHIDQGGSRFKLSRLGLFWKESFIASNKVFYSRQCLHLPDFFVV